jgi:hypothetical protein
MNDTGNLPEGQGGSGAPANEALTIAGGGEGTAGGTQTGESGGTGTQAAWLSQLPKEMKSNPATLKALSGYKTIGELAAALLGRAGKPAGQETTTEPDDDALAEALAAAKGKAKEAEPPPSWTDAEAARKTSEKLVAEFGAAASEYYTKALNHNGLGAALAKAGLKSHPDLGRALVLLGKDMSEESTVPGGAQKASAGAVTYAEGARLY